jgi:hypothetical protein
MILLRPRWLAWHSFVWIAAVGMLFLGDWQLHRAESGNELSWAYTFEWPLFSVFTVYFWVKSLRDELREHGAASAESQPGSAASASGSAAPASGSAEFAAASGAATTVPAASAGSAATAAPPARASAGAPAETAAAVQPARAAPVGKRADSWDATSWDAASWDATGVEVGAHGSAKAVDIARATPADGEAYLARLMAEAQRSGRRRGGR